MVVSLARYIWDVERRAINVSNAHERLILYSEAKDDGALKSQLDPDDFQAARDYFEQRIREHDKFMQERIFFKSFNTETGS
jgi:hypothetical protein